MPVKKSESSAAPRGVKSDKTGRGRHGKSGSLFWPVALIAAGLVWLAKDLGWLSHDVPWLAIVMIACGVYLVLRQMSGGEDRSGP
jgi:fatty acid desaturase